MKIKWFRKIRVHSILTAMAVAALAIAVFIVLMSNTVEHFWIAQKIGQIRRYTSFVARDISLTGAEDEAPELRYAEEMDNFTRLNVGDRIMILNDQAMVIQDSSKTKAGKYLINDDVLRALSGENVVEREGDYVRIAVPIQGRQDSSVHGVVYVFSMLDRHGIQVHRVKNAILLWFLLICLVLVLIFISYTRYITRPIYQIRNWLRKMEEGHLSETAEVHYKNEYQEIVEGVQGVTKELLEMDNSRKIFVSNVSHELKTPLSSMKVLTESLLLQEHLPEELYREFLQDINGEIDRQNALINDLLTLVRLDDGQNNLNIKPMNLNDMAEDILNRLKPFAEKMQVELVLDSIREVTIDCDEMKMTMALSNIIENGIKYNRENGRVIVQVDSDTHYARIQIRDTGIGIEEEHFSKLFDRFYRVDKARDRGAGGTGLGLSIVKQVIMLHGGRVTVDSTVGTGTNFLVTVPLKYTAANGGKNS